jgi:signal transduction histidine kinase
LNQSVTHTPLESRAVDQVEAMTNVEATKVKEQAKALGTARTRQVESDAVAVPGDAMDRRGVPLLRLLSLLKEVTCLSNPRFGEHQTIASPVEKLRAFYRADACLMVIADAGDRGHWLYQARIGQADTIANPERCAPEMAAMRFTIPWNHALVVDRGRFAVLRGPSVYVDDGVSRRTLPELSTAVDVLLSALDAEAVVTLPFRYHHDAIGRLYLTGRSGSFEVSDLDFLSHAVDVMLRVTKNVRLVDRFASEAADNERRRIARGIHETVNQPYIGLQLGLRAIVQRVKEGEQRVEEDLSQLLGLIDAEVSRLREYVTDLKGMPETRLSFMSALRRVPL